MNTPTPEPTQADRELLDKLIIFGEYPQFAESKAAALEAITSYTSPLRSELAILKKQQGGHDEHCAICNELCNALSANPSVWPIPLSTGDELGIVKWYHVGCVSERLAELAEAKRENEMFRNAFKIANDQMEYSDTLCDKFEAENTTLEKQVEELRDMELFYKAELEHCKSDLTIERGIVGWLEKKALFNQEPGYSCYLKVIVMCNENKDRPTLRAAVLDAKSKET